VHRARVQPRTSTTAACVLAASNGTGPVQPSPLRRVTAWTCTWTWTWSGRRGQGRTPLSTGGLEPRPMHARVDDARACTDAGRPDTAAQRSPSFRPRRMRAPRRTVRYRRGLGLTFGRPGLGGGFYSLLSSSNRRGRVPRLLPPSTASSSGSAAALHQRHANQSAGCRHSAPDHHHHHPLTFPSNLWPARPVLGLRSAFIVSSLS